MVVTSLHLLCFSTYPWYLVVTYFPTYLPIRWDLFSYRIGYQASRCIHNNIITYCCRRHDDDFGGLVDRGGSSSKLPTSCILQNTLVSHWWASQPWCIFPSHHLAFLSPSIHIRIDTEFHCHVSIVTWILLNSLTVLCMAFSGQRKVDMEAPPFWLTLRGGAFWQNGMPTCKDMEAPPFWLALHGGVLQKWNAHLQGYGGSTILACPARRCFAKWNAHQ